MTEQKYPADIIETVAKAAHRADCGCSDWRVTDDDHSYLDIAVAALDALGLTVTEEWRGYEGAPVMGSRSWAQHVVSPGTPIQRRALLVAETPWVEVRDA